MKERLNNYSWATLRSPFIWSWIFLIGFFCFSYIGFLSWNARVELDSQIRVAKRTISRSLQARDWDIAMEHLIALSEATHAHKVTLTAGKSMTIVGPLGEKPFGFASFCKSIDAGEDLTLSLCRQLLGPNEIVTLLSLVIFGLLFLLLSIKLLRTRINFVFDELTGDLEELRGLGTELLQTSDEEISRKVRIAEIDDLRDKIVSLVHQVERASREAATGKLATQVAHDIRSPLAALETAVRHTKDLPERQRQLISTAVVRIRDIANTLLESSPKSKKLTGSEPTLLEGIIESLLSEKRLQFSGKPIEIDLDSLNGCPYGLFAAVDPNVLSRSLSNIINNAVESIEREGKVSVQLNCDESSIVISVADNGRGIPEKLLQSLPQEGLTFGKKDGRGLGLHYARQSVESLGGRMEINSVEGSGTTVRLFFPKSRPPDWFCENVSLRNITSVIILDDDESIHHVWRNRLQEFNEDLVLHHFYRAEDLLGSCPESSSALFLVDYELIGSSYNGLEVIEKLPLGSKSFLVTSHHDNSKIQQMAGAMAVKILPKILASKVPFIFKEQENSKPQNGNMWDLVLIDDEQMVRESWTLEAEVSGHRILTVHSWEDLCLENIDKKTPIYIDKNLADVDGLQVANVANRSGFQNIYITTGEKISHEPPFLKGVVGKEFPL